MATLEQSIKMKNASVKAPAVTGQRPLKTPDTPTSEGDSGGIAKSKAVKNAGSTLTYNPNSPGSNFLKKTLGVNPAKNKTVEYF